MTGNESYLAGAILIDAASVLPVIQGLVKPDDFQIEAYRTVFTAAASLAADGEPVDPVSIQARARKQGVDLSNQLLTELMEVVPTCTNAADYAHRVAEDAHVEVRGHALRYVSRGGLKLEKAMQTFPITLEGKVCADIGASTGGFTDCMLQNGAAKVYAVDVGYGQLDWKLRSDARVVCLERTNARYLSTEQIPETLDFASIDVSFISLKLIFPALYTLLREGGEVACLIKPQFEAGREKVGKKGVVRDPAIHLEVLESFLRHAKENNFTVLGITYSPIRGPEGNIEYLGYLKKGGEVDCVPDLRALVDASHSALKEGHGEI